MARDNCGPEVVMRFRIFSVAALVIVSSAVLVGGGWAAITVGRLPYAVSTGQPVELTFSVRIHGVHLAAGLPARVTAMSGGKTVAGAIRPGKTPGYYTALFTLPHPGKWVVEIHSGHGSNPANATWLPLVALAPGQAAPPLSQAEWGARLFNAKGCITCHKHTAIDTRSAQPNIGRSLSAKPLDAPHVERTLRNPPRRNGEAFGQMPKLDLSEEEISALTAFLAAPRAVSMDRSRAEAVR